MNVRENHNEKDIKIYACKNSLNNSIREGHERGGNDVIHVFGLDHEPLTTHTTKQLINQPN